MRSMQQKIRIAIGGGAVIVLIFFVLFTSSRIFKVDITGNLPQAPSQPKVNIINANQYDLEWQDNANNESGFKIERSTDYEDGFIEIAQTSPNITNYIDSNLIPDRMYYYRVKSYNSVGDSDYSELTSPQKEVNFDLLAGIGSMRKSTHTSWRDGSSRNTIEPSENDQVANGWYRINDPSVILKINSVFRIDQEDDLKSQYMGVKGTNSNNADISFNNELAAPKLGLEQGDTLRLEFDDVKFSGYENLPNGSKVQYGIRLYGQAGNTDPNVSYANMFFIQKDNIDPTISGSLYAEGQVVRDLIIDGILYPNHPIGHLYSSIRMFVDGDIGDAQLGVNFSAAHIYVKKNGQSDFEKIIVPAPHNRNIKTGLTGYDTNKYDAYEVASNFDWVSTSYTLDKEVPHLKYYNPNIKVYSYIGAAVFSDYRDDNYEDPMTIPHTQFQWALENHPEWFYSRYRDPINKTGDMILEEGENDPREDYKKYFNAEDYASGDESKQIPYFWDIQYPQIYSVNPSISSYQDYFYNSVVKAVDFYDFDGVFVDTLGATGPWSVVDPPQDLQKLVLPDQVQKFQESVFPRLRAAGVTTIHNSCSSHYSTYGGIIMFNPYWKKDSLSAQNKPGDLISLINRYYGVNSDPISLFNDNYPDMTADFFFQEWAFFSHGLDENDIDRNQYSAVNWARAVEDMELVKQWNENLTPNLKKKIFQLVHGVDRPEDPALGTDGWAQFGLASYLLGASDYSWLGIDKVPYGNSGQIVSGFSLTTRLGDPIEPRVIHTQDQYSDEYEKKTLQTRKFSNGLVVVNGHPTQEASYTVEQNLYDEQGNLISQGTPIVLEPHSGRILFYPDNPSDNPHDNPPGDQPPEQSGSTPSSGSGTTKGTGKITQKPSSKSKSSTNANANSSSSAEQVLPLPPGAKPIEISLAPENENTNSIEKQPAKTENTSGNYWYIGLGSLGVILGIIWIALSRPGH